MPSIIFSKSIRLQKVLLHGHRYGPNLKYQAPNFTLEISGGATFLYHRIRFTSSEKTDEKIITTILVDNYQGLLAYPFKLSASGKV